MKIDELIEKLWKDYALYGNTYLMRDKELGIIKSPDPKDMVVDPEHR